MLNIFSPESNADVFLLHLFVRLPMSNTYLILSEKFLNKKLTICFSWLNGFNETEKNNTLDQYKNYFSKL